MPKLSVIVPVYNTAKYLRECIDSILAQTFTDFELILVDDGSTDGSAAICDEYADKDNRVRVLHQENGGATVARRSGVRIAHGEYVTFVDSDDWIDEDMYRIMLTGEPADILTCDMYRYKNDCLRDIKNGINPGYYDKRMLEERIYSTMLFDFDQCQPALIPSLCNKIIRTNIIRNVIENVADNITFGEDALCSYASMLEAEQIYVTNRQLYYYRENPESVSNVYNKRMFTILTTLGAEMRRLFSARNRDLENQVYGYLAKLSLDCVRDELLYHRDVGFKEKKNRIVQFVNHSLVRKALRYTIPRIKDQKLKIKMILTKQKMIGILYLLYCSRNGLA